MKATARSNLFFYLLLLFAIYITYLLLRPYLGVVMFSFVVVIIFNPLYDHFLRWVRNRKGIATALTILAIILTVLTPSAIVINITISEATHLAQNISSTVAGENASLTDTIAQANQFLTDLPFKHGYQINEENIIKAARDLVAPVSNFLATRALALGSSSAEWITNFIIFLSVVGTLFPSYSKMVQLFKDLSPLDDELDQKYVDRVVAMTKAMVKGVLVIALVQGLVAGMFFWISDTAYVVFLTLLAVFASVLPLGINILTIPVGLIHLVLGNTWQGIVVIVGSVLIVSQVDNVLRPKLVSPDAYLNPALVLLSAFGGLSSFGFLGVIYGPIIMIFFVTTIEIYLEYYRFSISESPVSSAQEDEAAINAVGD